MLDLLSVASQLRAMRAGRALLADEQAPRLRRACAAWDQAAALGAALRDRIARAKTSWLVAEPLEPLGAYDLTPTGDYRVTAADGSQILPDRHELGGCFLVNVGTCEIDYRNGEARLGHVPRVHWLPEDVYPLVGGERQEADGRVVGARRFAAECEALTEATIRSDLVLLDGTLLLWWLEPDPSRLHGLEPGDVKSETFAALERLLRAGREHDSLVAGYLSSPRTTDVVSMLKVVLCTEDPVDCDRCPYDSGAKAWTAHTGPGGILPAPAKPCEEVHPLADAALFQALLEPGQRSARFRSAARVAEAYPVGVDFFYVHTGAEIARVELPFWTTPDELDRLAGAIADQCGKGLGYPVTLQEAHEQAVVRAADRRTFLELVRRQEMSHPTAKLMRKRTSVL